MHTDNSIKWTNWQEGEIRSGLLAMLAALRIGVEGIKASRKARIVCWVILAALSLTLWTLVTFRVAQRNAERSYEAWRERYVNDYLSQREAEARGMPIDPRAELEKQENEAFARFIRTTQRFNFSFDDYVTAAWGMDARTRNPLYPDTFLEVLEQKGQFPYSKDTEVTKTDYATAERVMAVIRNAEHPAISSDYVYASFETDGVTLRDTWEISTKTHFWRYGD